MGIGVRLLCGAGILLTTTLASADEDESTVRASFATIQPTDTIKKYACSIGGPYDVQFEGEWCSQRPSASEDAIALHVRIAARRDDRNRDVIVEMERPANVSDEEARDSVTKVGLALREKVIAAPIVMHVEHAPPPPKPSPMLPLGYMTLGIGAGTMAGGVVVGFASIFSGIGCSMGHMFETGGKDDCKAGVNGGLAIAGGLILGGAVLTTIGGALVSSAKKRTRASAYATPAGGGMLVRF